MSSPNASSMMKKPSKPGKPCRCQVHLGTLLTIGLALCVLLGGCFRQASALERIQDMGTLRIAMDPSFPPFEFIDSNGQVIGLDVDLGKEIAQRIGVQAHFVTTTYDGLYDALTVGRADIILSALYPDPSRTQDFVFTPPYFNAGEVLVVPQASTIQGFTELSGKKVMVVFGTAGHMEALRWEELLTPAPQITTCESAEEGLDTLASRDTEALIVDNLAAQAAQAQGLPIHIVEAPITDEPYVIAARSEDSDLIDEITQHLQAMQNDGTLEAFLTRWVH